MGLFTTGSPSLNGLCVLWISKEGCEGAGEMARLLKAMVTLSEELGSIPSTTRKLTIVCNFISRGSKTFMQAKHQST